MRIKICGLTRAEDAQLAHELGAWALGFIFAPMSKRHVEAARVHDIIVDLPTALTVGVFVNQTDEAISTAQELSLGAVQLHGAETPEDCRRVKKEFPGLVIKAFQDRNIAQIANYIGAIDYALIDTAAHGQFGGTGQTADWVLAARATGFNVPVILAGGLNPANIRDAAAAVSPYALDLSSGVEAAPGIKDHDKLKALFKEANL